MRTIPACFLLLCVAVQTLTAQAWTHLPGPDGALLRQFDTDGDRLYVQALGGLFVSTDNGAHWALEPGNREPFFRTSQFQVEAGVWYVLTYDRTVERSTDRGASWEVVLHMPYSPWNPQEQLRRVFARGNTVLVATDLYLYRSADRGNTWQQVHDIDADRLLPIRAMGDYLFATDGHTVLRSSDDGLTWQPVFQGSYPLGELAVVDTVLYGLYDGFPRLIISRDHGDTWTFQAVDTIQFGPYYEDFADIITGFGDSLFYFSNYGCYHGGVYSYLSTDGGVNWQTAPLGAVQDKWLSDVIAIDGRLLLATWEGLYRSTNDPANPYTRSGAGFSQTSVAEIVRTASDQWWVVTQQGVYASDDQGVTWSRHAIGPDQLACGLPELGTTGRRLFFQHPQIGELLRSDDAGATWTPALAPLGSEYFPSWTCTGSSAWIQTNGRLLRWDDATPDPVVVPTPGDAAGFGFSKSISSAGETLFFSWDQKLYASFDAGQNWELVPNLTQPALKSYLLRPWWCNRHSLVAALERDRVFHYSFDTESWSAYWPLDGITGDTLRNITLVQQAGGLCWLGTADGGLYFAADPPGPWYRFTTTTPFLRPRSIYVDTTALWVGTAGGGIFTHGGLRLADPAKATKWKVYPNPSAGPVFLEASELLSEGPFLEIYDAIGRQLYRGRLAPGMRWDLSGVVSKPGIYVFVIQAKTQRETFRWVKAP